METQSRRQRSVEMASIFSESCTISSGASSRHKLASGKGASRGMMRAEDLLIDIKDDFSRDEVLPDLGAQGRSLRLRFPPH